MSVHLSFRRLWGIKAISFDLFDTLIGRTWLTPLGIFSEIECRLHDRGAPAGSFATKRQRAEFRLREKNDFLREVSLNEIYVELASAMGWDANLRQIAMEEELATEKETLFVVPAGNELLKEARATGRRILYVSDTYLPRQFLAGVLAEMGVLGAKDRLHLSVDYGAMKSNGELFHRVATNEGLNPRSILHVGDNPKSDFVNAARAGWRSILFQPTAPSRYELDYDLPLDPAATALVSAFGGIRRHLRLHAPPLPPRERVIREATIAVSGPLTVAFTAWCLGQAVRLGLKRLYFLSRDGEVLYRIAHEINARLQLPVALKYLYVSRQALLLPAIGPSLEPELGWILARTAVLTPRIILRRIAIDPAEVGGVLATAGFPQTSWDQKLSDSEIARIRALLLGSEMKILIADRVNRSRCNTIGYLRQEGLCDNAPFGLVDIGWNGTLQRSIARLREHAGQSTPTTGLYFGLHSRRMHRPDDQMLACFSDLQNPTRMDSIDYLIPLLELFVAARHGGVSGYEELDGRFVPRLRAQENDHGRAWGVETQQNAMLDLTRALVSSPRFTLDLSPLHEIMTSALDRFVRTPSLEEAKIYGSYLDAEDQNESVHSPLARPFILRELKDFKTKGTTRHHNEWKAGCVALTPPLYRWLLEVENRIDIRHPVCGEGIEPKNGFGPVEGPNPKFHLPKFMWAYGPEAILRITATTAAARRIRFALKNFHANQHFDFWLNDSLLTNLPVPQNFGEDRFDFFTMEIELPLRVGANELQIRARQWSRGDRPLAVIFGHVELLP